MGICWSNDAKGTTHEKQRTCRRVCMYAIALVIALTSEAQTRGPKIGNSRASESETPLTLLHDAEGILIRGDIYINQEGVLAKDPNGYIWETRRTPSGGISFFKTLFKEREEEELLAQRRVRQEQELREHRIQRKELQIHFKDGRMETGRVVAREGSRLTLATFPFGNPSEMRVAYGVSEIVDTEDEWLAQAQEAFDLPNLAAASDLCRQILIWNENSARAKKLLARIAEEAAQPKRPAASKPTPAITPQQTPRAGGIQLFRNLEKRATLRELATSQTVVYRPPKEKEESDERESGRAGSDRK